MTYIKFNNNITDVQPLLLHTGITGDLVMA